MGITGYKMTKPNGTAFYDGKKKYTVGKTVSVRVSKDDCDGEPCGRGLHLGKEKHSSLKYNARFPLRLFECTYDEKDILGEDADKVRVRRLKVEKELDQWDLGIDGIEGIKDRYERLKKYSGMKAQTPARKKKIESLVKKHIDLLEKADKKNRKIELNGVRFHSIKEWASVWCSVWDSVWSSVWASVWYSVWDSVWYSVGASVWYSVRSSVWYSVGASVWYSVWSSVWDSVRSSVWSSVWSSVGASVWSSVGASVWDDDKFPFLPTFEILEIGGIFIGVDSDGIAHVVMPDKNEVTRSVK